MATKRDFQKTKVYTAEDLALKRPDKTPDWPIPDIKLWIDNNILVSGWWIDRFRIDSIEVRDGSGKRNASAHYADWSIRLPRWARTKGIVLHEVAHLAVEDLAHLHHYEVSSHGPEFCFVFLKLIEQFLGQAEANELFLEFSRSKIRMVAPKGWKFNG